MFSLSSRSRDHISLRALCQILVNRSSWLESSIARSLASDVQIHFIYLMCYTALFPLVFIAFCILDSTVSYGRSKRAITVDWFVRLNFWEGRNVDISISSKIIKIVLTGNYSQHHVVYILNRNVFVFFHSQGLHIFASTLSEIYRSACLTWIADFSLR
jgi:hypothetical protein